MWTQGEGDGKKGRQVSDFLDFTWWGHSYWLWTSSVLQDREGGPQRGFRDHQSSLLSFKRVVVTGFQQFWRHSPPQQSLGECCLHPVGAGPWPARHRVLATPTHILQDGLLELWVCNPRWLEHLPVRVTCRQTAAALSSCPFGCAWKTTWGYVPVDLKV